MYNKASKRTRDNLKGVDHRLIALVGYALAISEQDFFVNEGLRTAEKQMEYFKKGVSQRDGVTKKSEHQLGRAVDVYYTGWKNTDPNENNPKWQKVFAAFKTAAKNLNIKIDFGAEWKTFKDYPHIELNKSEL